MHEFGKLLMVVPAILVFGFSMYVYCTDCGMQKSEAVSRSCSWSIFALGCFVLIHLLTIELEANALQAGKAKTLPKVFASSSN